MLSQHSFSVIRSAESDAYNFKNPVRRDTLNTGLNGSNATIRFVTDNAGPWFLHWYVVYRTILFLTHSFFSHIDWHLELYVILITTHTRSLT